MDRLLKFLSRSLAVLACATLVFVLIVTFIDVVGRYFFNAPLGYAVELVQLGMGLLVLFALPLTTLERGHIAVDVLDGLLPRAGKAVLASFASLVGFAFLAVVAWRLWDRGVSFMDDGLATDVLFLPIWPVVLLMAVAAAVAALVAALQTFRPGTHRERVPPIVDGKD